jgi:hypothetical protein
LTARSLAATISSSVFPAIGWLIIAFSIFMSPFQ